MREKEGNTRQKLNVIRSCLELKGLFAPGLSDLCGEDSQVVNALVFRLRWRWFNTRLAQQAYPQLEGMGT